MKKQKTKEEIIASLKLAETEEGRTGLVEAFLAAEKNDKQPKKEK